MFYYKTLLKKNVTDYKITFSAFASGMTSEVDEGILSYKYAKRCYNYKVESGALKDGIGFEPLTLPKSRDNPSDERTIVMEPGQKVEKMWLYTYFDQEKKQADYKILYYNNGKIRWMNIYSLSIYTGILASVIYNTSVPNAINYRLDGEDWIIFSSPTDGMWKYNVDYMAQRVENGPSLVSMCLHYERLFAILEDGERHRLTFSANLDPTNFNASLNEGGFIDMQDDRGRLIKVVSFNDYVYVFREFGVARVSAYGDQTTFSVTQLFASSSKIYANSICVCGDIILLLTRDGLYSFNGSTTSKITLGVESLFEGIVNEDCASVYHNGKYYLALRLNFDDGEKIGCENYADGYVNNAIIELDLKTGDISITRGVDVCSMLLVDDGEICKLLACFNGEHAKDIGQMTHDGKFFGTPLKKCWVSPKSNLGYPTQVKRIKEVFVKTKSPCEVKITTESTSKTFSLEGSNVTQRLRPNIFGEQVEVSFISESEDTDISCPYITLGVTSWWMLDLWDISIR